MIKSELKPALDVLKQIKMPKIGDKELRNRLIDIHFFLLALSRKVDEKIKDMETVFLSAFEDEQQEVQKLYNEFNLSNDEAERKAINREILSHTKYNDAVDDLNKTKKKLYDEEISGLQKIDREKFMEAVKDMDNFSLVWVEGLYPIFEDSVEETKEAPAEGNPKKKK